METIKLFYGTISFNCYIGRLSHSVKQKFSMWQSGLHSLQIKTNNFDPLLATWSRNIFILMFAYVRLYIDECERDVGVERERGRGRERERRKGGRERGRERKRDFVTINYEPSSLK